MSDEAASNVRFSADESQLTALVMAEALTVTLKWIAERSEGPEVLDEIKAQVFKYLEGSSFPENQKLNGIFKKGRGPIESLSAAELAIELSSAHGRVEGIFGRITPE